MDYVQRQRSKRRMDELLLMLLLLNISCASSQRYVRHPSNSNDKKVDEASWKAKKKLPRGGRRGMHRSGECATGDDVRVPCGFGITNFEENYDYESSGNGRHAALDYMQKTRSETQWYDEDGYYSNSVNASQIYHPESQSIASGKACSSDKRRNELKAKLRELVIETEPIPESCLLESAESKPEPEILAEVLLMSEAEGYDLADEKPCSVFDHLFADMTSSFDRSITISNAAPDSRSDMVVPVDVSGYQTSSFDIPNPESMIERTRTTAPPNLNAFERSAVYESFPSHVSELLNRTPTNQNISELLGDSRADDTTGTMARSEDYVMKIGAPAHVNRVRLNGTVKPIWFPGYVHVSPATPGCIRITDDPDEALKEVWRLCRPRHFPDRSRYLVNVF